MSYVIYNKETTVLWSGIASYKASWATKAAAQAAVTRSIKKSLSYKLDPNSNAFLTLQDEFYKVYAIAEKAEFHATIEKTRMTKNILNPNSEPFPIPVNTPACCDPGTETYHCM